MKGTMPSLPTERSSVRARAMYMRETRKMSMSSDTSAQSFAVTRTLVGKTSHAAAAQQRRARRIVGAQERGRAVADARHHSALGPRL